MPFYYKIFLAYSIFIKPFYWASYALKAINKFFNDLNAEQYDRMLKIAATGSAKSFD